MMNNLFGKAGGAELYQEALHSMGMAYHILTELKELWLVAFSTVR
jgi:hypothetical protein